jgi:hypothetical protein
LFVAVPALLALAVGGAAVIAVSGVSAAPATTTTTPAAAGGHLLRHVDGQRSPGRQVGVQPLTLRKGQMTGRTVAGPRPKRQAAPRATTGPIVVTFETAAPCEAFPAAAQTAFQAAVDIWNTQIVSSQEIGVSACWIDFGDDSVLGASAASAFVSDFPGLPPSTWYPIALGDAISHDDLLDPGDPEIFGDFSSTNRAWYFGTDGNTPAGQLDFESVVVHELGHGLGFSGALEGINPVGTDSGRGYWGIDNGERVLPTIFDRMAVDGAGRDVISYANSSTALGHVLRSNLGWRGANAVLANGNVRPRLYTPAVWEPGSSGSHLDENTYPAGSPNALMTPVLDFGESEHSPGPIVTAAFQDMGWAPICTPPSGAISTLYHPVAQARAYTGGTVMEAGDPADMPLLGRAGLPSSGVAAVVVNVEVSNPTTAGYISVTSGCTTSQTASQEFTAGATISNQVTVRLDDTGRLRVRLSAGRANVFVDVAGYYSTDPTGDRFHAISTTRANPGGTVVAAGRPLHLTVTGRGNPTDGTVDAIAATVEVSTPSAAGYVRVTPDGVASQTALQEFRARQTVSNLTTVAVVGGKIEISLSAGSARVFVDINGYYSVPSVATGDAFHPLAAARVNLGGTSVASTSDLHLTVAGTAGVPATGASAVAGVVEVSAPTAAGYVRVTPDGVVSQTATQEFSARQTISNSVAVGLSAAGRLQLHMSAGRALLFVDIAGYFGV